MILTKKAKEDFLNFYWSNYIGKTRFFSEKENTEDFFKSLYPILKNALIIEFFDSVGFYIEIILIHGDEKAFTFEFSYKDYFNYCDKEFPSRREAVERAIVNMNEIYNTIFVE